jgi:lipid-binding SYLF domain-containing protein
MKAVSWQGLACVALALGASVALADRYSDTITLFKNAGPTADFFKNSYGYAVFPTVGKGGLVVGAAHGEGRVYQQGRYIGDSTMNQVSVGFQLGGEAYSELVFFQDAAALKLFESGSFSLSADATAIAVTASASATAGTAGTEAGASSNETHATAAGHYQNGVAVFTVAKGGLMYQAAVAGQKFSFTPVH